MTIDSQDIRDAMRQQEVFGNHVEHGTDVDGWLVCSGTVEIDGVTYRVKFTALPDWSDWDLSSFAPVR